MNFQVGGLPVEDHLVAPDGMVHPEQAAMMVAPPDDGMAAYNPEMYPPPPRIEGEFSEVHSLMVDGGDRFGTSAVVFDGQEELIWMGNQGGHVTSYYGLGMQKYTSFQAHPSNEVRQLLSVQDSRVLSLTSNSLRCNSKFGQPIFHYIPGDNLQDMQCMLMLGPSSVLLGGHQPNVVELDINTQQEIRQVEVNDPGCAILRYAHHCICAGDTSGKVTIRDPNSLKAEHVLEAHSGTLSDFDVHGNQLITCGFSNRMGGLTVDRHLMVYDLRVMRAMSPMQSPIEPLFLRIVPTFSDRICVVSQAGQFQLLEQGAMTPNSMLMYQVHTEGAPVACFDISSSCNYMAFGDSGGYLHLFASGEQHPVYNAFSNETEFAPVLDPLQPIGINDILAPLSGVPMQYPSSGMLLSDWPEQWCRKVYRKPLPIDAEILRTVKMAQNVGYAPNSSAKRRNQVPYKGAQTNSRTPNRRTASVPDSPLGRGDDPFVLVPKRYRKVEIKYSKLGVEDFDFRHYNKTNFAGLETHIPNAYCNAMLQVLYFIEPLRCALLSHICEREFCLTCELGFLYYMLDGQKGRTCQASNFLRAFRTIPEASALGLILGDVEEAAGKANMPRLIQSWNRFILQQVHSELVESGKERDMSPKEPEEKPRVPKESVISKLFGTCLLNKFKCRCGEESVKNIKSSIFDLVYPELYAGVHKETVEYDFSHVVQQSMCVEQPTQAWCNKCEKYQPHTQTKTLKDLPDVLVFNCHLENARDFEFWKAQEDFVTKREEENQLANPTPLPPSNVKMCRYGTGCTRKDCKFRHENDAERNLESGNLDMSRLNDDVTDPGWVPLGLALTLRPDGKVEAINLDEDEVIKGKVDDALIYYDLLGTVSHVRDTKTGGNLISNIKVGKTYHQRKEKVTCTQWYLFNDFSITPVEKYEAVDFNLDWKIPCVIYFIRRDLNTRYNLAVQNGITSDALFNNTSSLVTPRRRHVSFTPLDDEELPNQGTVVGLDAEFVTLNQEEAELRSDGTRSTIKPSQMSLARVTCVRCTGPLDGEPFIDDYISTQEQVVDYLTQFSGIKPGDLDANISSKHLTTLKSTYVKLRYLIDTGVIFVGHGLKKDFRVINLIVPKDQVIDTVDLFHLPRQRMISLKFLAWFFLSMKIQSVMHDSIEDARTALRLYGKYQELLKDGMEQVNTKLKEMYEKGRSLSWKIPDQEGSGSESPAPGTPQKS